MTESVHAIHRGRLTLRFEELLKSSGSNEQFLRDVAAHCHGSADSPWAALAAIDQLYRRGKLSPQLFRAARIGIERRALGLHESSPHSETSRHASTVLRTVAAHPQPAPTVPTPTPVSEPLLEAELQRLRGELEQARREAADYRQRLDRVGTVATTATAGPKAVTAVAAKLPSRWVMRLLVVAAGLGLLAGLPARQLPVAAAALAPMAAPVSAPLPAAMPRVAQPGELALGSDRYVVSPGERRALIEVRRAGGSDGEVSLSWRIAAASARPGRDFAGPLRGTVALHDGQDSAQILVPLPRNSGRKHTEFFDLRIAAREGAALGSLQRTTVFLMPEAQALAGNSRLVR